MGASPMVATMAAIVPMELERACDKSETDDY